MLPKHLEKAVNEYIPHMDGWTTPDQCCAMIEKIIDTRAQICVDIGVFAARSTIAMGFAARQLNKSHVYGIDPWMPDAAEGNDDRQEGKDWWRNSADLERIQWQAARKIWDHHLEPWVTLIRNKSEHVHQLFPVIDFLNIDGGHSEIISCRDVELYVPKVRSGGFIFFDDTAWPSTQKALRLMEQSCDLIEMKKGEGNNEWRIYRKK